MPGYRLSDFCKKNLNSRYICSSCDFLLRDPIQTKCGHLVCESCLHRLRLGNSTAPVYCAKDTCRNVICKSSTFEDKIMRNEILALIVSCTFLNDGCPWKGKVQHLETHTTNCGFEKLHCVYDACGLLVKRGDLYDHLKEECEYRLEKCRFCDKEINHNTMKNHHRTAHNHLHCEMDNLQDAVDGPNFDGEFMWKISDYAHRRNDAVTEQQASFHSPCFYTSRYGYKMCARIHFNGDGIGKGTHISVSFVVMRGQYDALLRWPFRQEVTFILMDQDHVEHVIHVIRPDPTSSSFQRPRRETNIARGCPLFCSLAELNNHAYVRDDTMFLKIIVDTTDL